MAEPNRSQVFTRPSKTRGGYQHVLNQSEVGHSHAPTTGQHHPAEGKPGLPLMEQNSAEAWHRYR